MRIYEIHYGFTVAHVIMEAEICLQAGELGKQGYNSIRVQRPETQELRCPWQEKVAVPAQEGTDMPFICLLGLSILDDPQPHGEGGSAFLTPLVQMLTLSDMPGNVLPAVCASQSPD